jgi:hypothetical protein
MNSENQQVLMTKDTLWIQAAEYVSGVEDVIVQIQWIIQLTELYKICRYNLPTI